VSEAPEARAPPLDERPPVVNAPPDALDVVALPLAPPQPDQVVSPVARAAPPSALLLGASSSALRLPHAATTANNIKNTPALARIAIQYSPRVIMADPPGRSQRQVPRRRLRSVPRFLGLQHVKLKGAFPELGPCLLTTDSSIVALRLCFFPRPSVTHASRRESVVP
jgi:hypothetical protein